MPSGTEFRAADCDGRIRSHRHRQCSGPAGTRRVYEKEGAAGILLVIGQTLPPAMALRWPMLALAIVMASFIGHTGLDHGVIWVVQFTTIISLFFAINRGDGRQSLFSLVLVYVGIFVSLGIFREVDKVGNVLVQMLLFGGLWVIGNLFRTRRIRPESTEHVLKAMEAEQDRLARDLHDIIGHTSNVIVVQAGAARTVFKSRPDQALESLNSIETTARQSLSDMERMLGILRPVEFEREPYSPQPGLGQVDRLAEVHRRRSAGGRERGEGTLQTPAEPRPLRVPNRSGGPNQHLEVCGTGAGTCRDILP